MQTVIALIIIAIAAASGAIMFVRALRSRQTGCPPARCASCPHYLPREGRDPCAVPGCPSGEPGPAYGSPDGVPADPEKK